MNQAQVITGKTIREIEQQTIEEDLPAFTRDVAEIGRHLAVGYIGLDRKENGSVRQKFEKATEDFSKIMKNIGSSAFQPLNFDKPPAGTTTLPLPATHSEGRSQLCNLARGTQRILLSVYDNNDFSELTMLQANASFIMANFTKMFHLLQTTPSDI